MNTSVMREYLVSLGFSIDNTSMRKFDDALRTAAQQVERYTGSMAKGAVTAGAAVVTALGSIGAGVLGLVDNVASADLSFQIFARRMFMGVEGARHMKMALDQLGVSAEDVLWGPKELRDRYRALIDVQKQVESGFGGTAGTEKALKQFRDLTAVVAQMELALKVGVRGFVGNLITQLFGDGQAQAKLQEWLKWLIANIPRMSQDLASTLAPSLKNIWQIFVDLGAILRDITGLFLEFVGAVYGDDRLKRGEVSLKAFGAALEDVSGTVRKIVSDIRWLVDAVTQHPFLAGVIGGAGAGAAAGTLIGGPAGMLPGAAIGAVLGGGVGAAAQRRQGGGGSTADQARQLAARIGASLGIPAEIIFGQFAHETGGFTNRGARDLHTLAGIRMPGSSEYRNFGSFEEFADYYTQLLGSNRYRGTRGAQTPEDFARGLKSGGYYEDSYQNYVRGIRRGEAQYQPMSSTINVGGITVHVGGTSATAEDIHKAVLSAVEKKLSIKELRNIYQQSGVFA
jgi:hypothetical protein